MFNYGGGQILSPTLFANAGDQLIESNRIIDDNMLIPALCLTDSSHSLGEGEKNVKRWF